ncbi:MAG: class I SAM-dependent methyltransferase [Chloroflexi bacterium]|nr:class I SAM-dependent methyltransferase [Chloroflexota bacterium]
MASDNTERFSSRVDNYIRYRPSYPPQVLELLQSECGLNERSVVADIGSGTGILTELLLKNGNRVFGIEPNTGMRAAAERLLAAYPQFTSVAATAEATTLRECSADLICAGQSFHWFDLAPARVEWKRILTSGGYAVLVWNERSEASTPFMVGYTQLLSAYGTDYGTTQHKLITVDTIRSFYGGQVQVENFENRQMFDFESLRGRLLSSSYSPEPGHANYEALMAELRHLFEKHKEGGVVQFDYDTNVFYGPMA